MNFDIYYNLYKKAGRFGSGETSPVLKLFVSERMLSTTYESRQNEKETNLPMRINMGQSSGMTVNPIIRGIRLDKITMSTPLRVENVILTLFTSTNFNNIKDITKIKRGRYTINFKELNIEIIGNAFRFILTNKNKRISKSWLEPMQERLLQSLEVKPKKLKNKRLPSSEEEEPEVYSNPRKNYTTLSWSDVNIPAPTINHLKQTPATGGNSSTTPTAYYTGTSLMQKEHDIMLALSSWDFTSFLQLKDQIFATSSGPDAVVQLEKLINHFYERYVRGGVGVGEMAAKKALKQHLFDKRVKYLRKSKPTKEVIVEKPAIPIAPNPNSSNLLDF